MRAILVALLLAAALLAGCSDTPDEGQPVTPTADLQYQDDAVSLSQPLLPSNPPAAGERTLEKAPEWRLGEYWRYQMTDGFQGKTYEFTRVVAGSDDVAGNYLVGFPEEVANDVLLLHIPGFGDVRQQDLAYETHDAYFQPLQFPLRDGKSWDVSFEGVADGLATVKVNPDGTADIDMEVSIYGFINATYDPAIGEISRMEIPGYATYEVVEHGYNYEGVVRVPHAHDLIFNHGRLAGVQATNGPTPTPAGPEETVEVGAGYDRASFIIALGAGPFLGVDSATPSGVFQETVTAPDQTQYTLTLTPAEGGFKLAAFGNEAPAGTWTLQHVAAGAGVAFVEGIGYHSIDIELPTGCVVESFNAQHHTAPCRV